MENFKPLIPIKPYKVEKKSDSFPKWRWKMKHRIKIFYSTQTALFYFSGVLELQPQSNPLDNWGLG